MLFCYGSEGGFRVVDGEEVIDNSGDNVTVLIL